MVRKPQIIVKDDESMTASLVSDLIPETDTMRQQHELENGNEVPAGEYDHDEPRQNRRGSFNHY